jgi:YHS domain-containing protein
MASATRFVTDPVCGMTLPVESTLQVEYRGNEYYFCEPTCAEMFRDQPEGWLASPDWATSTEAPWPNPRPRRPERGPVSRPSSGL